MAVAVSWNKRDLFERGEREFNGFSPGEKIEERREKESLMGLQTKRG